MCCGLFKNDLFQQNLANESLIEITKFVLDELDNKKNSKNGTELLCKTLVPLQVMKIQMKQELIISHSDYDTNTDHD